MLYYEISDEKLNKVTEIFNKETNPEVTAEKIKAYICADWSEGDEHQEWIDTAKPEEIADWLAFGELE